MHDASLGELGSWLASSKGTIWKVCGGFIIFSQDFTKTKEVKKRKDKKQKLRGSYKVNVEMSHRD
jgi:hypothetical protein